MNKMKRQPSEWEKVTANEATDNGLISVMPQLVKNLPPMQETQVLSLGWEDLLEEEMATPSSILAWRISWTEEPGRMPFMGSHRAEHD